MQLADADAAVEIRVWTGSYMYFCLRCNSWWRGIVFTFELTRGLQINFDSPWSVLIFFAD
jgi:hypothetical protein